MLGSKGYTLLELMAALGIVGVLMGSAVSNLKELERPLSSTSSQLMGLFKQARARAISTTSAYFIEPDSSNTIVARFGTNCDDASPVDDDRLGIEIPSSVTMSDTSWSVCFTPRGLADQNITVYLQDNDFNYSSIEVFLGGAVKVTSY